MFLQIFTVYFSNCFSSLIFFLCSFIIFGEKLGPPELNCKMSLNHMKIGDGKVISRISSLVFSNRSPRSHTL